MRDWKCITMMFWRDVKESKMADKKKREMKAYKKLILKSGLYDEAYYRRQFEELPEGDLLEYFILNGENEDKNPSEFFNVNFYLDSYDDVKKAGINPLIHYILFGKAEGRSIQYDLKEGKSVYDRWCKIHKEIKPPKKYFCDLRDMAVILKSGKFKGAWYIDKYEDAYRYLSSKKTWKWRFGKNPVLKFIAKFTSSPLAYYVKYGMYRNENPTREFSNEFYMNNNADLIDGPTLTPFVHYILHGEREGRLANYSGEFFKTLKEIFIENKGRVSVINNRISLIKAAHGAALNENIKNADGNIIYISKDGHFSGDVSFIEEMFNDESVFAVVLKSGKKNFDILSYIDFAVSEDVLNIPLSYDRVYFRKPDEEALARFDFNTAEGFNNAVLHLCAGGKVGLYYDESIEEKAPQDVTEEYTKNIEKVLFDVYCCGKKRKYDMYAALRKTVRSRHSYEYFAQNYKAEDYIGDGRLNILIGIYAFSHGGGEIMPIRLANRLYQMGHNVTVAAYCSDAELPVRKMLLESIPVFYTNEIDDLAVMINALDIKVVSTHHQAMQRLVSDVITKYPQLKGRFVNVATSHGMYENFDDETLEYIFKETKLMENTDYWTYVADKNIIPFERYGVFDEERFIKVPNGMERPKPVKVDLSAYGINKNSFTIAIASRALKEKGWLNAIEAVEKARLATGRDIHLLLIGSGEVYDKYRKSKGNRFIHFLGFRDNPCDYFYSADLCMLPSYYASESAPLCLIEAMMCGKPSIAAEIGDVKYMLSCGGRLAGSVFPLENMTVNNDVLAEEIVKMVTDRKFYEECCAAAREKAGYFEISNIAELYINVYKKGIEEDEGYNPEKAERINRLLIDGENGRGPLVSVIVPNYNHSAYLPMRLDSVFGQTYKNIQVLLMDDCSTDNSREILRQYNEKYPDRSVILFNESNSGGVFHQWTKGIRSSKGEICWIAESDDYCEPTFLENVLTAFDDPEVKLSYCQYVFVNENNEENRGGFFNYVGAVDKNKWHKNYVNDSINEVETALGFKNTIPNASGAVFRNPKEMDLFADKSWYDMKICGDWIFYLYVIQGGKVAYTVDTKSYFRFHTNNSSAKTYGTDVYYKEHMLVAQCIRRIFAPDNDIIVKNYETIKDFYFRNVTDGTEEKFKKLFNLEKAMEWQPNAAITENSIARHSKRLFDENKEYKTLLIDPILSATDDRSLSLDERMTRAGGNSGNMLFVKAVEEQINSVGKIWFSIWDYNEIREKYENISSIIPSSNFIIKGSDTTLKGMDKLYSCSGGSITMAGLGAQAYEPYNTPRRLVNQLSEYAKDFFRRAADRCTSLGVRGEFTAECLELMGIHNYRIIGCPTCYKYFDGVYKPVKEPDMSKPVFNVTGKRPLETSLLKLGIKADAAWLIQMRTELPQIIEGEDVSLEEVEKSFPGLVYGGEIPFEEGKISYGEFKEFMLRKGRIFFNMDKWNEFMEKERFSFSFGSRFHGNMSAFRSGTPALWITHDSRTAELVNTLHLPSIGIDRLESIENAEELLELCDYSDFYRHYGELAREYAAFLNENHIENKFSANL